LNAFVQLLLDRICNMVKMKLSNKIMQINVSKVLYSKLEAFL